MSALDHHTSQQLGEKGMTEYGWSNSLRDKIVQINFQLVRSLDTTDIAIQYRLILAEVFSSSVPQRERFEYAVLLYKMVAYTRDIIDGKGEYHLAHVLIAEWARLGIDPYTRQVSQRANNELGIHLAEHALLSLVSLENQDHPLGSWKDMKYFLNYWVQLNGWNTSTDFEIIRQDPIVHCVIELVIHQISMDCGLEPALTSLVARWVPREKSNKFGWQTPLFACAYYKGWYLSAKTPDSRRLATRKCLTHFRKLLATMNKALNTPQINQCEKDWSSINFDKHVTSMTLSKQKNAFQNKTKNGEARREDSDRSQCAQNYTAFISRCLTGESSAKGARVSMYDFVKEALTNISTQTNIDTINLQWADNASYTPVLGDMLAMIDVSSSMEEEERGPLYNAIGLGIRIAEKSKFGRRAMSFAGKPSWIKYADNATFVEMVHTTKQADWGGNTNILEALRMILSCAIENHISPECMPKILTILSDMMVDGKTSKQCGYTIDNNINPTLYNTIKREFRNARCAMAPNGYECPVILFWNLRQTNGFPVLADQLGVHCMSGWSPTLLSQFCNKGMVALQNYTPFGSLVESLNNSRYDCFEQEISILEGSI